MSRLAITLLILVVSMSVKPPSGDTVTDGDILVPGVEGWRGGVEGGETALGGATFFKLKSTFVKFLVWIYFKTSLSKNK